MAPSFVWLNFCVYCRCALFHPGLTALHSHTRETASSLPLAFSRAFLIDRKEAPETEKSYG